MEDSNGANGQGGAGVHGQGDDDGGLPPIIEAWTSEMLKDYKPHRPRKRQDDGNSTIAFGRTTKKSLTPTPHSATPKNPLSSSSNMPIHQRGRRSRISMKGNCADDNATTTSVTSGLTGALSNASSSTRRSRLSGQEAKHIGRQMFTSANGPEALAKAQEKRRRQLTYSQEIRHAASAGNNASVSLQIDSITRVVVQSFRKLINCERCALFLMDHKRDQLYFKPVGDPTGSGSSRQVQVIRFSASKGVAGWVATNRSMLNIKNAYADGRFNQDIDKQTNFRTRTILCVPVLESSGNRVLGVIQMVNKLVEDGKAKQKKAKNTKSDDTHHGYLEVYETFSSDDEETLQKCARQVSTALEDVLSSGIQRSQGEKIPAVERSQVDPAVHVAANNRVDEAEKTEVEVDEAPSSDDSSSDESSNGSESDDEIESTTADDPIRSPLPVGVASPADGRRRSSAARRSSIASLVQFVSAAQTTQKTGKCDGQDGNGSADGANGNSNQTVGEVGISEALQRFQFRSASGRQISNRRGSLLAENPEFVAAETKRKRMEEYNEKRKSLGS